MKIGLSLLAVLLLSISASAQAEDDPKSGTELTKEEAEKVRRLFRDAQEDEKVKSTRAESREAVRRHQEALRRAMIARDPSVEPALRKMQNSISEEVAAKNQDENTIRTLDLPLNRLSKEERRRWMEAFGKVRRRDFVSDFRRRFRESRQELERGRQVHRKLVQEYRGVMREALLQTDPELAEIFQKLEKARDERPRRNPPPSTGTPPPTGTPVPEERD